MQSLHISIYQPAPATWLDGTVVVLAATATLALVVLVAGACVVVWMTVRGSRPQDRPAVLRALALVLDALATLVSRRRRR